MAFFRGDQDPFADPFFSEARQRPSFMLDFGDPFQDFFGRTSGHRHPQALGAAAGQQNLMMPFGGHMTDPFSRMNEMMANMHNMAAQGGHGSHSFSQSSVMHITHDRSSGGQPKVYQASVSSRSGPGGVRETNKMERDSETGTQKTSVSHQIGDRSRTMNKKYNFKTKEAEQVQEFINLDEDDASEFDAEWKQKTQRLNRRLHGSNGPSIVQPSRGLPSTDIREEGSDPGLGLPRVHTSQQRSPRYSPYTSTNRRQEPVLNDPSLGGPSTRGMSLHQPQQQRKKKSSRAVKFNPQ